MLCPGRTWMFCTQLCKALPVFVAGITLLGCGVFASQPEIATEIKAAHLHKRFPSLPPSVAETLSGLDDTSVRTLIEGAKEPSDDHPKSLMNVEKSVVLDDQTKAAAGMIKANSRYRNAVSALDPEKVKAAKEEGDDDSKAGQKFMGFSL